MHHIQLSVLNMCPNDIDKQTNRFQEMKYSHHVGKRPVKDMDRLNFNQDK